MENLWQWGRPQEVHRHIHWLVMAPGVPCAWLCCLWNWSISWFWWLGGVPRQSPMLELARLLPYPDSGSLIFSGALEPSLKPCQGGLTMSRSSVFIDLVPWWHAQRCHLWSSWLQQRCGWNGHAESDGHASRAETTKKNTMQCSRFLNWFPQQLGPPQGLLAVAIPIYACCLFAISLVVQHVFLMKLVHFLTSFLTLQRLSSHPPPDPFFASPSTSVFYACLHVCFASVL